MFPILKSQDHFIKHYKGNYKVALRDFSITFKSDFFMTSDISN